MEALTLIVIGLGEYFSAKFFIAKVAEDLYLQRKMKDGVIVYGEDTSSGEDDEEEIKENDKLMSDHT